MNDPGTGVRPFRWRDRRFELLDQRLLPHETVWLPIDGPAAAGRAIADMAVRGAPAIGIAAAYGLALLGEDADDDTAWRSACEELADSRPTAVNLRWAIARMDRVRSERRAGPEGGNAATLAHRLRVEADAIAAEDLAMNRALGEHGARALLRAAGPGEHRLAVLTHCNTGGLATAGWGTALGVIRSLHAAGRLREAWATETRPYGQGVRLTVWELAAEGIPHRLLADSAAGAALAAGEIQAVVVGADRIAADGTTANKIGTYNLAVLAARHGVPFYVAAPVSTVDLATASGADIPIEHRDPDELRTLGGRPLSPADTPVWNPAFDLTPPALITAIVLNTGVVEPPFGTGLADALGAGAAAPKASAS